MSSPKGYSPPMSQLLPVVPLAKPVLTPGMITRVHFTLATEVAAVDTHIETNRPLVVIPPLDPLKQNPGPTELANAGCLAQVTRVVRLGDGSIRVLLEGAERVFIKSVQPDPTAGMAAEVVQMGTTIEDPGLIERLELDLKAGLRALIEADPNLPSGLAKLADIETDPSRLTDRVAANLTLPYSDWLAMLSEPSLDNRMQLAMEFIAKEREFRSLKNTIQMRTHDRLDKQQRDYYLREQIRALQSELEGGTSGGTDEASQIEAKLKAAGMPDETLKEALKEVGRMRRMPPDAAEYNVARTWLDWLVSMPWSTASEDCEDLHHARAVLDEGHNGLEKVKDRILEHLAVAQLNPNGRAPILCFVGPPGVGKTTLGQSIARALGRSYQRVSLGGVKDEAEIRGHRRTYVGAMPGRLVNAIKRAGSNNPVIVLDEIDKLGADFRGDPTSALLEVLDPEQNSGFVDHYLDVPWDLSRVLFVCTANMADLIPAALYDRLEMIEIPGYILEEKLQISTEHLLPRLRTEHGLESHDVHIDGKAVHHIIEAYTAEAGLRNLVRELAKLHRKAARQFVEGRTEPFHINDADEVTALLGPPRHIPEIAERVDVAGIALGLAWTSAGGDILFIEATRLPGGKGLKLTGSLGDVMKESAEAAMSVLQSMHQDLGIDKDQIATRAIHLHVPAGSIPKDGPSAGVTMVTAMASLLTGRKVKPTLAMSGEITLRGKVLPVGGVREKVLAARRAGVRTVLLPAHNEKDLVDVPEKLLADIEVHFVEHIADVLRYALEPATS
jgi:ATP-dependent Lon protease